MTYTLSQDELSLAFLHQNVYRRNIDDVINSASYCTVQAHLSDNHQLNLMLRGHNWNKQSKTPVVISYKIDTKRNTSSNYKKDFWSLRGRKIDLSIKYLKKILIPLNYTSIAEVIIDGINRGEFHLFENNFANSFLQQEYLLSIYLKNIQSKYKAYPYNKKFNYIKNLAEIKSIYEFDSSNNSIPDELLLSDMEEFFVKSTLMFDSDVKNKIQSLIKYTLSCLSSFSNVEFVDENENPQVNFYILPKIATTETMIQTQLDKFHHFAGKTIHSEVFAFFLFNPDNNFSNINYNELLHTVGHIIFDHPNDSNIANRTDIFPPDDKFSPHTNYNISNEYRADNGCMSVMAFTSCFYNGKEYKNTLTYMPIDIQVAQYLYGKNNNTRSGDTTYFITKNQTYVHERNNIYPLLPEYSTSPIYSYRYSDKTNATYYSIYTLYDAGGINSFNLKDITGARIDLNQGASHFNEVGDNVFIIAYGVEIHNIIIETGTIEITLNHLANKIFIPSKGARVIIKNFEADDHIILSEGIIESFSGCVHPFMNINDTTTEICFI